MSTKSNIIFVIPQEMDGKVVKFNPSMIADEFQHVDGRLHPELTDRECRKLAMEKTQEITLQGGKTLLIYHHWDGYPSGVGATLLEKYNNQEQALNLVLGGSVSSINGCYTSYAVRGEKWDDIKPRMTSQGGATNNVRSVDYGYMWKNGKWHWKTYCSHTWRELTPSDCEY